MSEEKEFANESYTGKSELVTKKESDNMNLQLATKVCKIKSEKKGTGFFCKIPFPDQFKLLPVFITNNHVLNEEDISTNKIIKISFDDDKISKEIKITEYRRTFTDKNLDVTIIEIFPNSDEINDFLDVDEYNNKDYKNEKIYVLQYPNGLEQSVSVGKFKDMDDINIQHECSTDFGSSGSPILLLSNFKVIGVHKRRTKYKFNEGTFIKYAVEEFNKKFENNNSIINNFNEKENKINEGKNNKNDKYNMKNKNENNAINIIKENSDDEITIKYKIGFDKEIKLFGQNFVENNKQKCKMIIDGKENEICSYYKLDDNNYKKDKILEIKLRGIKNITNMSYMFYNFESLTSLPDISKWDTSNVTNMSYMFCYCKNLFSLPDISKWNTNKVTNMSHMFSGCESLTTLPDISQWDTSNTINMSGMFSDCKTLKKLPDISDWITSKVTNMNGMFSNCESLVKLPDISDWETSEVTDMRLMFSNCKSLKKLPEISSWNTNKVTDMRWMFSGCESLSKLDISKWNINRDTDFIGFCDGCSNLESKPELKIGKEWIMI